jgi:CBS domain-containing protein
MRIEQLMTHTVHTCGVGSTLNEAAKQMWDHDCGALPVVDGSGTVVGMITDRDICMAAYFRDRPLSAIPVAEVMSKQVYCCRPDEPIEAAEGQMRLRQVRRIPVVNPQGQPVGMVTLADLARRASSTPRQEGVERDVLRALNAVCRSRNEHGSERPSIEFRAPSLVGQADRPS